MYWANLETRNFSFNAFSDCEAEALELLREAWRLHREQSTHYDFWLYEWHDLEDSVGMQFVRVGDVLRDGEILISGNTPKKRESK